MEKEEFMLSRTKSALMELVDAVSGPRESGARSGRGGLERKESILQSRIPKPQFETPSILWKSGGGGKILG